MTIQPNAAEITSAVAALLRLEEADRNTLLSDLTSFATRHGNEPDTAEAADALSRIVTALRAGARSEARREARCDSDEIASTASELADIIAEATDDLDGSLLTAGGLLEQENGNDAA